MELGTEFEAITMDGCGHVTALPVATARQLRRRHGEFYCSTCGQDNYFPGKSDIEREREKTERAELLLKTREEERDRARDSAESADRSANAYKGHLTRQRNRTAAGLCPCCTRSFENLARHIETKHPTYHEREES